MLEPFHNSAELKQITANTDTGPSVIWRWKMGVLRTLKIYDLVSSEKLNLTPIKTVEG